MLDPETENAYKSVDFWGLWDKNGQLFHNGSNEDWHGMQPYSTGDVLRLLLDSEAGTLTVKKNGALLGVAVTSGLTGDLCWAVADAGSVAHASAGNNSERGTFRIKALDPAEF